MSFLCFNPLSDVPNVTTFTPYLGFWALHPLVLASLCSPPHSSFYQLLSTPAGLFLLLLKYFRFAVSSAWNISSWLFLISQVSAQKPFPERTCQIMVAYKKSPHFTLYQYLSNPFPSLHLFHSLYLSVWLFLFSVSCLRGM